MVSVEGLAILTILCCTFPWIRKTLVVATFILILRCESGYPFSVLHLVMVA